MDQHKKAAVLHGRRKRTIEIHTKKEVTTRCRRAVIFMLLLIGLTILLFSMNKLITKKCFSLAQSSAPMLSITYTIF